MGWLSNSELLGKRLELIPNEHSDEKLDLFEQTVGASSLSEGRGFLPRKHWFFFSLVVNNSSTSNNTKVAFLLVFHRVLGHVLDFKSVFLLMGGKGSNVCKLLPSHW